MNNLLRQLPAIRRIRGNRLYTANGKRILDLWLDDGRGILGERDRLTRTCAANAGDKGLLRPYPGLYDSRFAKALGSTWQGFGCTRVFLSEERALEAATRILGGKAIIVDAARPPSISHESSQGHNITLARPFVYIPATVDLVMPRLPCPRPYSPWCLAARTGSQLALALEAEQGDIVPAQALLAATRGLASLEASERNGYAEPLWNSFERRLGTFFKRTGPYLFAITEPGDYEAFFMAALAGGALISPRPDAPSIVPPSFDDGELQRLARALELAAISMA